jgi:type I restriction enzyme S subunit
MKWIKKTLKSLILTNKRSVDKNYNFDEILYLDTGSITENKVLDFQKLSLAEAPSRAKRLLEKDDIIYSTVRPINRHYGYFHTFPDNLVVSTGFVTITSNKHFLDSKYLYYYLTSDSIVEELDIIAEASTTTYPSFRPSDLENLEIFFPEDINEQKAIASVLSSLDDKIDLNNRIINNLENMAQNLLLFYFPDGLLNNNNVDNISLNKLLIFYNGYPFKSHTFSRRGKFKIITIKNILNGDINTTNTNYIDQIPKNFDSNCLLSIGDVLMTLTGNVGRVGIVIEQNLLLNQRVAKISPINKSLLPFIYFLFRKEEIYNYLISLSKGTAQLNLSTNEALKTIISYKKHLIYDLNLILAPLYLNIINRKSQNITLKMLRDQLINNLLSKEFEIEI